jgi:hypothetical protein
MLYYPDPTDLCRLLPDHLPHRQELGFGCVEPLTRGCCKDAHVVHKGLHHWLLQGLEQGLSVIGILGCMYMVAWGGLQAH